MAKVLSTEERIRKATDRMRNAMVSSCKAYDLGPYDVLKATAYFVAETANVLKVSNDSLNNGELKMEEAVDMIASCAKQFIEIATAGEQCECEHCECGCHDRI